MTLRAQPGGIPIGAIFLGIGLLTAVAVGVFGLDRLPFPACVFKAVTGWPCLTCGTTRTLGRLFTGDMSGAFAMNPLAASAAFVLVPWGLADCALLLRGRALSVDLGPRGAQVARFLAVSLLLVNWGYLLLLRR